MKRLRQCKTLAKWSWKYCNWRRSKAASKATCAHGPFIPEQTVAFSSSTTSTCRGALWLAQTQARSAARCLAATSSTRASYRQSPPRRVYSSSRKLTVRIDYNANAFFSNSDNTADKSNYAVVTANELESCHEPPKRGEDARPGFYRGLTVQSSIWVFPQASHHILQRGYYGGLQQGTGWKPVPRAGSGEVCGLWHG